MKRQIGNILSKILTYENSKLICETIFNLSNYLGIHEFELDKIPDEPQIIAINHAFNMFGNSADIYLILASSPRKVIGFFNPEIFKREISRPILEAWGGIPATISRLIHIRDYLKNGEIIGIAPEGPSDNPNPYGELSTTWIARELQYPITPIKISSTKRKTTLEVKPQLYVPKNAGKEELREITYNLMELLR